ncbi:MAG: hypothetical protein HCA25_00690 (plasmid) [Dolichospermum sp. DET50]|nr:hypothetical protein [Dolichospermum sp. DET66]MBS3035865.1 hypothetical protein [Dolichospermum sp. DET67]MBS3041186.1 hypothetical protein [Dolichospermum sp. DET50]QSX70923.1 MAG: hypothetical protein EZY12_27415 [Dolichospermum sp. DET69]
MNKNLETFDIRNFLDRLTPKKGKNRYICPVCEGSLTVDIKTGKYQCWGEPDNKQHLKDIREAVNPLEDALKQAGIDNGRINYQQITPAKKPDPLPAPLPQNIELAKLPAPGLVPQKKHNSRGSQIIYTYSDAQYVVRYEFIEDGEQKKLTIPYYLDILGNSVKGIGDQPWPVYHQEEIIKHGQGQFVLVVEGEKCTDAARQQNLVTTTFQGSQWTDAKLEQYCQCLKSHNIAGIVYYPDNDKAGYNKANKLRIAANKIQLPYIELNPQRLNPDSTDGYDIADLIADGLYSRELLENEIQTAYKEHLNIYIDAILAVAKQPVNQEISREDWECKLFIETLLKQAYIPQSISASIPLKQSSRSNLDVDVWFDSANRLETYNQTIQSGKKYILDISSTGAGKSDFVGKTIPEWLQVNKLWYISSEHRNPTTKSIEENYTDLPVRNNGLYADDNNLTPLGNPTINWPKNQAANIPGNCHKTPLFHKLASKGYHQESNSESSLNPICHTCKFKANCQGVDIEGNLLDKINGATFRRDRREALMKDRIRCHINSLPSEIPKKSIAFVDESSRQINLVETTELSLTDYQKTLGEIARHLPEVWEQIKDFISPLEQYLSSQHKENYYGYNHNQVRSIFGDIDHKIILNIIEALKVLSPDLEGIFQSPDSVSLDGIDTSEREGISRKTLKYIRYTFGKEASQESHELLDNLIVNWLTPLLEIIANISPGALRIKHHKLIITTKNTRQLEVLSKFQNVFLLDATATRKTVAFELGIDASEILVICEKLPNYSNLKVVQITDLGLCGKDRSESKVKQLDATKTALASNHQNLGVIDHLKHKQDGEGYWFKDNRGTNKYMNHDALFAIGSPYQDIGAVAAKYATLTGDYNTSKDNPQFQEYIEHLVKAEIIQMGGRLRANRRPDEALTIYLTSNDDLSYLLDYYPGATLTKTTAFEITPTAGDREQVSRYYLLEAFKQCIDTGIKCTQKAVAKISKLSQPYISKIASKFGGFNALKKILLVLIEALYRDSNNFSGLSDDEKFLVNDYLPLIKDNPPPEVVQELLEVAKAIGYQAFSRITRELAPDILGAFIGAIVDIAIVKDGRDAFHTEIYRYPFS